MAEKLNYAKTIRAAKKGDLNAYQALYDATIDDVAAICKKLLNSSTDPDSVIVDTYITLFQSLETMKNPKAFPTYAAEAAATQCYNANQLRPAAPADLGAPRNALDVTEDTLNALNNGQRTALLLQSHGMTPEQIANVMGVTEYTVNSDIYFGKKKLQKAVAAYRPTINFDEYGVGNEVTDRLLSAYSSAVYESVPPKARDRQFSQIINIFEGNEEPAHVDEPIAPEVETSPAGEETVVEEPKAQTPFFVAPEEPETAASTDETQTFQNPYVDEEPTQVVPPTFNTKQSSSFNTKSTAPQQQAPKKTYSVPKQTAAVSRDSGNTKKILMTVIIVLLVAILVTLIIVFATRNRTVEQVTTSPNVTSSFTLEDTTESTTTAQTRRRTTQATTEEQTEAPTTTRRTEPATHATQAPTHAESGGGENGVVEF